jgi:hypothetical protein
VNSHRLFSMSFPTRLLIIIMITTMDDRSSKRTKNSIPFLFLLLSFIDRLQILRYVVVV